MDHYMETDADSSSEQPNFSSTSSGNTKFDQIRNPELTCYDD